MSAEIVKNTFFVLICIAILVFTAIGLDMNTRTRDDIISLKQLQFDVLNKIKGPNILEKVTDAKFNDKRVVKVIAPKQFSAEMTTIDGHDYLVLHDLSIPSVNVIHYGGCKKCGRRIWER